MNALVPNLRARGVEAIVVLIHQGGYPTGDYNECPDIAGPIVDIVRKFDSAVDVVTQRPHPPGLHLPDRRTTRDERRPYGTVVTAIDVTLDRRSATSSAPRPTTSSSTHRPIQKIPSRPR